MRRSRPRHVYRVRSPILQFRKELKAPGFASPVDLPFIPKPPDDLLAAKSVTARHDFDFETFNPWSRFYMNNAQMDAKVKGSSVLSREQAASGAQSAKVTMQFPPAAAPYSCYLKLFTVQFQDCEAPLKHVSCMLYGAKQGNSFRLRIRDKDGECFYGPMGKLDWSQPCARRPSVGNRLGNLFQDSTGRPCLRMLCGRPLL